MSHADDVLQQLIGLSRHLGEPARDYVILGEGNTSARIDEETFWLAASGSVLGEATESSFLRIRFDRILDLVDGGDVTDEEVRTALLESKVDDDSDMLPSTETAMHAVCLSQPGVSFVGHTHPTPVNMFTCSRRFEEAVAGRLFPDEVVMCGPDPVLIPYADPGVPLARVIRDRLAEFGTTHDDRPRMMYMKNHGLTVFGVSARQVQDTTAMAMKAARILVGTYALGGPSLMDDSDVRRIHVRDDEHYRQRILEGR